MAAICSRCLRTVLDDEFRCAPCGGRVVRFGEGTEEADGENLRYSSWDLPRLFQDLESASPMQIEDGQ
jgi:hypothetical protein